MSDVCVVHIELYLHLVRVQHSLMREVCNINGGAPPGEDDWNIFTVIHLPDETNSTEYTITANKKKHS